MRNGVGERLQLLVGFIQLPRALGDPAFEALIELTDLFFDPLALGYVADDSDQPSDLALLIELRDVSGVHVALSDILVGYLDLELDPLPAQDGVHVLLKARVSLFAEHFGDAFADNVLAPSPESLGVPLIHELVAPFAITVSDQNRRAVGYELKLPDPLFESLIEKTNLLLGPLTLGYVPNHDAYSLAATIGDHVRANLYTNQRTVLAAVAPLAADVPLLRQHALYVAVHVFLGVRDHIVERQP